MCSSDGRHTWVKIRYERTVKGGRIRPTVAGVQSTRRRTERGGNKG